MTTSEPKQFLVTFDDGLTVEQRAAAWLAQTAALHERTPGVGVVARARLASEPGLALMQAWVDGTMPTAPFGELMGMDLVEAGPGRAVFQGLPAVKHTNMLGTVHGGYFATILDSAVGCAVHTTLAAGQGYTSLELKVNFLRTLTDRVGPIRAEGRVLNLSKQTAIADGRIYDAAGKLYAHATTTCLVFAIPTS